MITKKGSYKINQIERAFIRAKKEMPKIIAVEARNHFSKGFKRGAMSGGGFTNNSSGGWAKRKRETNLSRRKNILVKKGRLRKAATSGKAIFKATFNQIVLKIRGSDVKYASYHNEGSGRLPKREFWGDSRVLFKRIKVLIRSRRGLKIDNI